MVKESNTLYNILTVVALLYSVTYKEVNDG
jgi:hypothetical protein